jgi:hypothetical protein
MAVLGSEPCAELRAVRALRDRNDVVVVRARLPDYSTDVEGHGTQYCAW